MDANTLTFGLKDVVAIVSGVIIVAGFVYGIFNISAKNKLAIETLKDSTKLSIDANAKDLAQFKVDYTSNMLSLRADTDTRISHVKMELKEAINQLRQEQQHENQKLSTQMISMSEQLNSLNKALSELIGFIKAQQQQNKQ